MKYLVSDDDQIRILQSAAVIKDLAQKNCLAADQLQEEFLEQTSASSGLCPLRDQFSVKLSTPFLSGSRLVFDWELLDYRSEDRYRLFNRTKYRNPLPQLLKRIDPAQYDVVREFEPRVLMVRRQGNLIANAYEKVIWLPGGLRAFV